jgi:glycosyltransferase involved in cell wall biosynthesis
MADTTSAAPRVTVIIATYHWSTVLPFSIASVLAQTFRDFELLVIGDGCTDDSEAVVNAVGDSRVRWINLPENTGHQSRPNNRGLAEARGEFIAYLGHDDLWLPHHLELAVRALDATGAALTYSLLAKVPPDARFALPYIPYPERGYWTPPAAIVHRRSMTERIGGWRHYRDLRTAPDSELWRRAHAAGFRFEFVPRLTAVKFAASDRRGVYRDKPCHEQAAWLARIKTEPSFEVEQLANMIVRGDAVRAITGRSLIPLVVQELVRRVRWRLSASSGRRALFWWRKGAAIPRVRTFKGL